MASLAILALLATAAVILFAPNEHQVAHENSYSKAATPWPG